MRNSYFIDCRANFSDSAWVCAHVWKSEGKAIKWIARALHSTPSTVRYNLVRAMPSNRAASRPPPLSRTHIRDMKKRKVLVAKLAMELKPGPTGHAQRKYPNAASIARAINLDPKAKLVVSACMVRRDLKKLGFKSLRRQRGPKRMEGDHARRVLACKRYLRLAKELLARICFSDEKYFDSDDHGADREWCPPGVQPSRVIRDTWAPRVHVWGVIGHNIKFLVRIPTGKLSAAQYKRYCLMPFMAFVTKNNLDVVLQYDGDSSHRAESVLKYIASKGVKVLEAWPARSPELSPIENCWAVIQKRVDSHGPSDVEELWKFIRQEWDAMTLVTVNNLVDSFKGRCERCVAGGGETIRTKA